VFLWALFFTCVGLIFIFRGVINGAPGALRVSSVYVIWPLAFILLITAVNTEKAIIRLMRVMVFSSIVIGLLGLMTIFRSKGILPDFLFIRLYEKQVFSVGANFAVIHFKPLESFLFLLPFILAALITWPLRGHFVVARYWLWLALLVGILMAVLSSRMALLLVIMIAPIISFFFSGISPSHQKKNSFKSTAHFLLIIILILMSINIYLNYSYQFNFHTLFNEFTKAFDPENSIAQSLRKEQFIALLDGWGRHPFLGGGHGATVDYTRSEKPWAYELYYVALLYQVGILGFIAYSSGIVWIYGMAIRIIRKGGNMGLYMMPLIVGMTCFLIANATNSYLAKFDFMWTIFFPIAVINHWLISKPEQP